MPFVPCDRDPWPRLLAPCMLAAILAAPLAACGGGGETPADRAAPASAPVATSTRTTAAPDAIPETSTLPETSRVGNPPAADGDDRRAPAEQPTAVEASAKPAAENVDVAAPPLSIGEGAPPAIAHVLVVSVDGLRSDVLESEAFLARLPAFARLLRGPHTLDARTDPDHTITLPNHVSMITGRPVAGPAGHHWTDNDDPPGRKQGGTLHAHRGEYVASMFDVAHDAGVETSVVASKTKFWLLEQSYNWSTGAPDADEPDHGRAKIDCFVFAERAKDVGRMTAARLAGAGERSLSFIHFAAPDVAGHSFDWKLETGSAYLRAIEEVDAALGVVLATIDADPALAGRTAVVLTADHGGGVPRKTHTDPTCPLNFRIPFVAWTGDAAALDLCDANPGRPRPGREDRVARDAPAQPIRNGDAANLALRLLGLPPVPGSRYGR